MNSKSVIHDCVSCVISKPKSFPVTTSKLRFHFLVNFLHHRSLQCPEITRALSETSRLCVDMLVTSVCYMTHRRVVDSIQNTLKQRPRLSKLRGRVQRHADAPRRDPGQLVQLEHDVLVDRVDEVHMVLDMVGRPAVGAFVGTEPERLERLRQRLHGNEADRLRGLLLECEFRKGRLGSRHDGVGGVDDLLLTSPVKISGYYCLNFSLVLACHVLSVLHFRTWILDKNKDIFFKVRSIRFCIFM